MCRAWIVIVVVEGKRYSGKIPDIREVADYIVEECLGGEPQQEQPRAREAEPQGHEMHSSNGRAGRGILGTSTIGAVMGKERVPVAFAKVDTEGAESESDSVAQSSLSPHEIV